jgi:hypothetical protein
LLKSSESARSVEDTGHGAFTEELPREHDSANSQRPTPVEPCAFRFNGIVCGERHAHRCNALGSQRTRDGCCRDYRYTPYRSCRTHDTACRERCGLAFAELAFGTGAKRGTQCARLIVSAFALRSRQAFN